MHFKLNQRDSFRHFLLKSRFSVSQTSRRLMTLIGVTRTFIAVLSVFTFYSTARAEETVDPARYDWVKAKDLTPAQRANLSPACSGAYIDPLNGQKKQENLEQIPLNVEANEVDMSAAQIEMNGNVSISQGNRRVKAEHMSYEREGDKAELSGDVEIRQPGILVRGTSAMMNTAGQEASFSGGEFVLHEDHLHGSAGKIEHKSNGVVVLDNGSLTSCEPGSETWQIKGAQLRVNPITKQGTGKNVTVEVAGIPIFYVPYFTFPVGGERQSGLLTPTFGSSEGGIDITQPWYWNIAPNYDATFAPRYAHGHGAMLETEFRYMNSVTHNNVTMALLPSDEGGGDPDSDKLLEDGLSEETVRTYKDKKRWLARYEHTGGDDSRWYSIVDYTRVSDIDYFRDISPESFAVTSNTYLSQNAVLGYRLQNWDVRGLLQTYQNLLIDLPPSYRQLPKVNLNGRYTWGALGLSLNNEWVNFTHQDPTFVTGQRANFDYQLEWNRQWQWGYVRPQAGIQSIAYNLNQDNLATDAKNHLILTAPYLSLDTSLIFESGDGKKTLEPRLFYLYRQATNHNDLYGVTTTSNGQSQDINFDTTPLTFGYDQMFRTRRFAGGDRLGDANQLTIALTTRWLSDSFASPLASLSVGQVLYFSDQKVSLLAQEEITPLEESDLASKVTARITDTVQFRGDFLYNPKEEQLMRATTGVEYQDASERRLRLDYRFVREDELQQATLSVDQIDAAFSLPFGLQWQVVGRLFYDLDYNKELEAFVGFEYDDCCYRLRFLARRWLDSKLASLVNDESRHYDSGVFLEVDLKGLASSGKRVKSILAENIPGYQAD